MTEEALARAREAFEIEAREVRRAGGEEKM